MIIGLCGLAGSGKSSVSKTICSNYGYARRPFAFKLKCMLGGLGIEPELLDGPSAVKELPLEMFGGKTLRHAMQSLGTEWGRAQFGEDFWVNIWLRSRPGHNNIVADDVRFANEAAAIKSLGGIVVRVEREGAGSRVSAGHTSENVVLVPCDATLRNNGDLLDLEILVDALMRDLSWARADGKGGQHGSISQTA